jgi:tRNA-2-methylthio-N6-dimethylallyladenosine synthase
MNRIDAIKRIMPDCSISADIIAGFCSETDEEHKETLSLMEYVHYNFSYMFKYSERPNTLAQRKYKDDIPEEVKQKRLAEIIELQRVHSLSQLKKDIGKTYEVLVEGVSKKSEQQLYGRNTHNSVVVFPRKNYKVGDYVNVLIKECTSATLKGEAI